MGGKETAHMKMPAVGVQRPANASRTECVFCIPLERNIAARNCKGLLQWRCWFGISGIVLMRYANSLHAGVDQQPLPTAIGGCCGGGAIANNEASSAAAGIGTCGSQGVRPSSATVFRAAGSSGG